jgi:UDP-N-acetyl-D-mannosaminuronate dehydrogenase
MTEDTIYEQDTNYMLSMTIERKEELKARWKLLLQNKDRDGKNLTSTATVNRYRVIIARDLQMCALVEELLMRVRDKEIMLSNDAVKGYEKLVEPRERRIS